VKFWAFSEICPKGEILRNLVTLMEGANGKEKRGKRGSCAVWPDLATFRHLGKMITFQNFHFLTFWGVVW
jgi:hypothetical protein